LQRQDRAWQAPGLCGTSRTSVAEHDGGASTLSFEVAMIARLLVFALVLLAARCAAAQDNFQSLATEPQGGVIIADLEEQLTAGLKIRREEEERFVAAVLQLVEEKRLPVSMVKSVFHWARRKNAKVPYPYFERAMRLTAAKIGVEIIVPTS
jgi:hypothetical protein